jgi:spermidine/putrescine transport system permease protein
MLRTLPRSRLSRLGYTGYVGLFLVFLALPLIVVAVFAFNDSQFPAMPWKGFTLGWFVGRADPQIGLFFDASLMRGIGNSLTIAVTTTCLAILVGTTTAFLFERHEFPLRNLCYMLMLAPLVIPGVILGISILAFSSRIANGMSDWAGIEIDFLRPGRFLIMLGQFSFITTVTTLVIAARLRKFDRSLEEAALNLGATPQQVLFTITLPYLRPAMIGAGIVSFLMSFENFNTTLMLVGSDAPLTIAMFDRMKQGSTPVINAVSLVLMLGSSVLGIVNILVQRPRPGRDA